MDADIREYETPSRAVQRTIANQEECATTQLGRLTEAVNVDRLDDLRDPPIEFRYCGYHVEVTADRTVHTDP